VQATKENSSKLPALISDRYKHLNNKGETIDYGQASNAHMLEDMLILLVLQVSSKSEIIFSLLNDFAAALIQRRKLFLFKYKFFTE
jgi:hypothetical protein